jgi:bifunctional isochorismate lyase/aryl carrier protein
MGLPAVESYSMPGRPARASWTIEPHRAALLVHDMQNHFVEAFPAGQSPVLEPP